MSVFPDDLPRAVAIMQGRIVRAAHVALRAAGETAPEFEFLTSWLGCGGNSFVRLSSSQKGRGQADLRPGDRLYALLDDQSGVYERTAPRANTVLHRTIRFDGTVEVLRESPFG